MPSAAALRTQIENALERRFPSALTPVARTTQETAATGIPEVDRLLDGGLPVGAISELTGPESSGRTSLALSFLARRTQQDQVCAWVDVNDAFDAESAAASGVSLRQMLWVRCRSASEIASGKPWTRLQRNQSSCIEEAHGQAAFSLRKSRLAHTLPEHVYSGFALDQALRATDLLLHAGGFAAVMLDLGSTAPEHASRIPLATWFRFRQAADRTRCSLLVLAQASFAQSSAALVLECAALREETTHATVLSGFTYEVRRGRQRFAPAMAATCAWECENRGPQRQVLVAGVKVCA
jgi:hypothetical protein